MFSVQAAARGTRIYDRIKQTLAYVLYVGLAVR